MDRLRCAGTVLPLDLIEERMGKKTEGESADSRCADEKTKG